MGLIGYSNCSPLTTGCFLYQDSGLTTPVVDGSYSDGTNVYSVSGGSGQIASVGSCPVTTTTTTTTTTAAPTTTTTTTTTTAAPTTTTTTTTTTAAPTTTTTTTTTTLAVSCNTYNVQGSPSINIEWFDCGGSYFTQTVTSPINICAETGTVVQTGGSGTITDNGSC